MGMLIVAITWAFIAVAWILIALTIRMQRRTRKLREQQMQQTIAQAQQQIVGTRRYAHFCKAPQCMIIIESTEASEWERYCPKHQPKPEAPKPSSKQLNKDLDNILKKHHKP